MNNYLDDVNNVRNIYINFCEYIENKQKPEKDALIQKIQNVTNNQLNDNNNNIRQLVRDEQARLIFRSFLTRYVILNSHLINHRVEIVNMRFNPEILQECFELFNNSNNYLK